MTTSETLDYTNGQPILDADDSFLIPGYEPRFMGHGHKFYDQDGNQINPTKYQQLGYNAITASNPEEVIPEVQPPYNPTSYLQ